MNMLNRTCAVLFTGVLLLSPMLFLGSVAEAQSANQVSGTVQSIDWEKHTLTISSQTDESAEPVTTVLSFTDTLMATKDGQSVTLSEVKEGDIVSVEYQVGDDNNNVIQSLTVGS